MSAQVQTKFEGGKNIAEIFNFVFFVVVFLVFILRFPLW